MICTFNKYPLYFFWYSHHLPLCICHNILCCYCNFSIFFHSTLSFYSRFKRRWAIKVFSKAFPLLSSGNYFLFLFLITNWYVNNWFMAVTAWRWHCIFLFHFCYLPLSAYSFLRFVVFVDKKATHIWWTVASTSTKKRKEAKAHYFTNWITLSLNFVSILQ